MTLPDTNMKVKSGETFIRQGEQGALAYVIEKGLVEIRITKSDGTSQIVGTRGPGSIIGEMSLIDEAPRTASVTALEDCQLIKISRDDFMRRLKSSDEIMQAVMRVLMTRYRDTLTRSVIISQDDAYPSAEETERHFLEEAGTLEGLILEQEFKSAMFNGQLYLNYQPIVSLQNGQIMGFESLMRWKHPERNNISPAQFIPMAEHSGLIVEASRWALRQSCRMIKEINDMRAGQGLPACYISVNFSTKDFAEEDFLEQIQKIVVEEGVTPRALQIEITESLLMQQPERAKMALEACRNLGFLVAIDDFGTGYSSLSYLHKYPISSLKIDQSFVRDMLKNKNSFELSRSIIALGKNLNMTIVAEGIEGKDEALTLKNLGCDIAQGYYFARPQGLDEIRALIGSGTEFSAYLK